MNKILELSDIAALGHDVEEIYPRVFRIRNFTLTGELEAINAAISTFDEAAWTYMYMEQMRKNAMHKFGRDDLDNLIAEGLLEVTSSWADKNATIHDKTLTNGIHARVVEIFNTVGDLEVTSFTTVQRMYEGVELKSHYDQYSDKLVEYAAVLYLNEGYTAGELFFPVFNLTLTPDPGDLMIFPGVPHYEHGVRPVGPGPIRYVIPTFIKKVHPDGTMAGWGEFGEK
jgi:hypothetical protein